MSDTENKLDRIFEVVFEMKPILSEVRESQKAFDARMRAVETIGTAHGVKIDRLQEDVDGLGRKVRHSSNAGAIRGEARGGKWLAFLEILAALPTYWHVGFGVLGVVAGILGVAWKHHQ